MGVTDYKNCVIVVVVSDRNSGGSLSGTGANVRIFRSRNRSGMILYIRRFPEPSLEVKPETSGVLRYQERIRVGVSDVNIRKETLRFGA